MAQDIADYLDGDIGHKQARSEIMPEKIETSCPGALIKSCASESLVHDL